ncbi:hypothetical protein A0H81_01405 [Grifola frondosa]|uniref:Uncharacterized protein n=1 Tax=Grifola frondosa TaxID=5627 RepID=A0A1C7MRQ6_GRIFR|nr:hypothetical protein A0H81_01405 [Grifola frondosa]
MLCRSSAALNAPRVGFTLARLRLLPSARGNAWTTPASIPEAPAAPAAVPVAPKRSIPRASSFGDIVITNTPKNVQSSPNQAGARHPAPSATPGLDWLGVDEFGGAGFRARLQVSRAQQQERQQSFQRPSSDTNVVRRTDKPSKPREERGPLEAKGDGKAGKEQASPVDAPPPSSQEVFLDEENAAKDTESTTVTKSSKKAPTINMETTNLDQLFGPPVPHTPHVTVNLAEAQSLPASPAAIRLQLLLERSAGDYSQYVPRTRGTTDPSKLGPVNHAQFVLSRRRDVRLKRRAGALGVVEKLTATDSEARSPASA